MARGSVQQLELVEQTMSQRRSLLVGRGEELEDVGVPCDRFGTEPTGVGKAGGPLHS